MSQPPSDPTGRAPGPAENAPDDTTADQPGSAPWERPRRWNQQRLNATRVDDLLARLGNEDEAVGRRRRRRQAAEGAATATGDDQQDDAGPNNGAQADQIGVPDAAEQPEPEQQEQPNGADGTPRSERTEQISAAELIAAFGAARSEEQAKDDGSPAVVPVTPADHSGTETTDIIDPGAASTLRAGRPVSPVSPAGPVPPAPELPRFGGPGVVTMPGYDDLGTDQLPTLGPQEDVSSIRESLRRQHAGASFAAAAPAAPIATGHGQAAEKPARSRGMHAATGSRRTPAGFLLAGRAAVAAVSVLVLVFTGIYWNLTKTADAGIAENSGHGSYVQPSDTHISTPSSKPQNSTAAAAPGVTLYPPENILLLGSDTRAGGNGNAGNDDGNEQTAQSDTIMLAHLSADRQNVTVLSVPRDLHVKAPHCKIWNSNTGKLSDQEQPVNETTQWKITNAYSVGGPACTVKAIQQLTGLRVDRVIGIDFNGFKTMVDALGGVTVNVCRPIVDRELQTVVPAAGVQTIRGDQALNLVRARKVIGDPTGDYGRIRRQQMVLSAMLRQLTSAGTLLSPGKLDNFLKAFTRATFTDNVTFNSMLDLAHSLGDLAPGKVTFFTIPAHANPNQNPADPNSDYQVLEKSKADAMFAAVLNDQRLPGEAVSARSSTTKRGTTSKRPSTGSSKAGTSTSAAAVTTTSSASPQTLAVDPAQIKLQIVNETGVAGKSTEAKDILNGYGFDVSSDDLLRPQDQVQDGITVEYTSGNRDAAVVVAATAPGSKLVRVDDTGNYQVRLILGSSWDGNLTAVKVGDTVPSRLQTTPASATTSSSTESDTSTATSSSSAGQDAAGPATTTRSASTLSSTDLNGVNAEQTGCL